MPPCCRQSFIQDVVYVTIGNPAFCLALYLTGVHLRASYSALVTLVSKNSSVDQSELEKYEVSNWKRNFMEIVNCGYIRTQEIGGVRLQEKLYARGGKRITAAFAF